jgi:hypothetical protein
LSTTPRHLSQKDGQTELSLLCTPLFPTIPIDWTKVPEASKKFLYHWGNDRPDPDTTKKFPPSLTIEDLVKMLHKTEFFSYISTQLKIC